MVFFGVFLGFICFNFWLWCVFIAACGFSLIMTSRGYSPLWCSNYGKQGLLISLCERLRNTVALK